MSWEIKIRLLSFDCSYLKLIDEFQTYAGCEHHLNKTHECNKKNCPIKV